MKTNPLESLLQIPSPLHQYSIPDNLGREYVVDVKREDLIHPTLSGNKYRKLHGHLDHLRQSNLGGVVTMGGPWSNHLHACSWLCHQLKIPCVLLVRGHAPEQYSAMLTDAMRWGAQIEFVPRQLYRELRLAYEAGDTSSLLQSWPDYYFIPEGGRHLESGAGFKALAEELQHDYDAVYMAVGTATSIAGLMRHWSNCETEFHGVLAVDAIVSQSETIELLAGDVEGQYKLRDEFIFGGYARTTEELNDFIQQTYTDLALPLEPVYTAKAFYGLVSDIKANRHPVDSRLLFIHSGGLQGLRGFDDDTLLSIRGYYDTLENLPFENH